MAPRFKSHKRASFFLFGNACWNFKNDSFFLKFFSSSLASFSSHVSKYTFYFLFFFLFFPLTHPRLSFTACAPTPPFLSFNIRTGLERSSYLLSEDIVHGIGRVQRVEPEVLVNGDAAGRIVVVFCGSAAVERVI